MDEQKSLFFLYFEISETLNGRAVPLQSMEKDLSLALNFFKKSIEQEDPSLDYIEFVTYELLEQVYAAARFEYGHTVENLRELTGPRFAIEIFDEIFLCIKQKRRLRARAD